MKCDDKAQWAARFDSLYAVGIAWFTHCTNIPTIQYMSNWEVTSSGAEDIYKVFCVGGSKTKSVQGGNIELFEK